MKISHYYEIWKNSGLGISTASSKGEIKWNNSSDPFHQIGVKYGSQKKKEIRRTRKFSICPCAAVCTNYIWNKFPLNKGYKLKYSWDLDFTSLMLSYLAYDLAENMNRSKVYGFLSLSLCWFFLFFLHFTEKKIKL